MSPKEIEAALRRRGTTFYCIAFKSPEVVPDILYPQLRKTERTLIRRLVHAGFETLRSDVWSNSLSIVLLELSIAKLPKVQPRVGPPITVPVGDFIRKHTVSKRKFTGPFVDAAGRLVFEVGRKHRSARQVIELALLERAALGRHVSESLAKGYSIYEGKQVIELCRNRKFARFLSEYLTRCLPWHR
jgi:tRNA nucleotidyltransferase (CCA-adding enzyme)